MNNEQVILREQVKKVSKTKLVTHKRLLELRNDLLCYYSHVPQNFEKQFDERLIPKQGVQLEDIEKIEYDEFSVTRIKQKQNALAIFFVKENLISMKQRNRNSTKFTITNASKQLDRSSVPIQAVQESQQKQGREQQSQLHCWIFYFDNQDQRNLWIQNLEKAIEDIKKDKNFIMQFFEEQSKQQQTNNISHLNNLQQQQDAQQQLLLNTSVYNHLKVNLQNIAYDNASNQQQQKNSMRSKDNTTIASNASNQQQQQQQQQNNNQQQINDVELSQQHKQIDHLLKDNDQLSPPQPPINLRFDSVKLKAFQQDQTFNLNIKKEQQIIMDAQFYQDKTQEKKQKSKINQNLKEFEQQYQEYLWLDSYHQQPSNQPMVNINIQNDFYLLRLQRHFRQKAVKVTKQIVNIQTNINDGSCLIEVSSLEDLTKEIEEYEKQQKVQLITKRFIRLKDGKDISRTLYVDMKNRFLFFLGWVNLESVGQEQSSSVQEQDLFYNDRSIKLISSKFKYLNELNEGCLEAAGQMFYKIGCILCSPLACLVEYMGFKLLIIAFSTLNTNNDNYKNNVEEISIKIQKMFAWKFRKIVMKETKLNILTGQKFQPQYFNENDNDSITLQKMPQNQEGSQVYQIINSPLNYEQQMSNELQKNCFPLQLRPEISQEIQFYIDKTNAQKEKIQQLLENKVNQLVELLDSGEYNQQSIIMDSQYITSLFHSHGINMKYLGKVAEISNNLVIKSICIQEMFARALKKILRQQQVALLLASKLKQENHQQQQPDISLIQSASQPLQNNNINEYSIHLVSTKSKNIQQCSSQDTQNAENQIAISNQQCILELLNQICTLKNSKQANTKLWGALNNIIKKDFYYTLANITPSELNLPYLLNSILFHCKLVFSYGTQDIMMKKVYTRLTQQDNEDKEIFKPNEISLEPLASVDCCSEVFKMSSLTIHQIYQQQQNTNIDPIKSVYQQKNVDITSQLFIHKINRKMGNITIEQSQSSILLDLIQSYIAQQYFEQAKNLTTFIFNQIRNKYSSFTANILFLRLQSTIMTCKELKPDVIQEVENIYQHLQFILNMQISVNHQMVAQALEFMIEFYTIDIQASERVCEYSEKLIDMILQGKKSKIIIHKKVGQILAQILVYLNSQIGMTCLFEKTYQLLESQINQKNQHLELQIDCNSLYTIWANLIIFYQKLSCYQVCLTILNYQIQLLQSQEYQLLYQQQQEPSKQFDDLIKVHNKKIEILSLIIQMEDLNTDNQQRMNSSLNNQRQSMVSSSYQFQKTNNLQLQQQLDQLFQCCSIVWQMCVQYYNNGNQYISSERKLAEHIKTVLQEYIKYFVNASKLTVRTFIRQLFDTVKISLANKGFEAKINQVQFKEEAAQQLFIQIQTSQILPQKFIDNMFRCLVDFGSDTNFNIILKDQENQKKEILKKAFDSFEYLLIILGTDFFAQVLDHQNFIY